MDTRALIVLVVIFLASCSGGSNQGNSQGDPLVVSITLDSLPPSYTYNKTTTPDGYVEYKWGITFDINNSGTINQGDIVLRILHFKATGSIEQTGPISDFSADLWEYTSDTQTTSVANAASEVTGDTITISIDKSAHATLSSVTNSTLVYFENSTHDSGAGISKYDYHPSFKTLMSIPFDGDFTDPLGDADFSYIDMLSMNITL